MGALWDDIRNAVASGRYVVSDHPLDRLRERGLVEWHIEAGTPEAKLLLEKPHAAPNPAVEVSQLLPDGSPVKVVWSWLRLN